MQENTWLTDRFEDNRSRLRAVAYRMLGSLSEADDAVQETWLRLSRADTNDVSDLTGWLVTVTGRVCLDMLRHRRSRREDSVGVHLPDPIVDRADGLDPENQILLANSVGIALLVVLDTLDPAERLAFVLHDMFGLPFEEIANVVGKSPAATRQLASRARRRVQGSPTVPDADIGRQREVVNAFFAAAREGNFDALVSLLDPNVVLRADAGEMPEGTSREVHGAAAVAGQALTFRRVGAASWGGTSPSVQPALVNGVAGVVVLREGAPQVVFAFTVSSGKIAAIDIISDAERLRRLDVAGSLSITEG